ncbi:hypothetical protein SAMN05444365_11630 [Micromonospora pattaloongensis]|uniref:DUF7660 domain-containing protein n=1 Tax=Micromonospora pattaloongensis TaxID=405436 RepID=A0A1H3SZU0_9ACTN|nr:hypothetical protein [Micromonospora pattaloongensis]SDZ43633.1 hypothetical protein SAMN05444365_11630 [Micromonospora pattaloongensis]
MNAYETGRSADISATDLDRVASHADVAHIVERMLHDLRAHPDAWENGTLERFLDALAASFDALPPLHANRGERMPDQPTWKLIAEVLVMATGYE